MYKTVKTIKCTVRKILFTYYISRKILISKLTKKICHKITLDTAPNTCVMDLLGG